MIYLLVGTTSFVVGLIIGLKIKGKVNIGLVQKIDIKD